MGKCDCYHLYSETRYSCLSPFDLQTTVYGVCLGTKEQDRCNCEGDESKCDFYPEKRKAAEKMLNTAQMWLKAKEDGKTYVVNQENIAYSNEKGLFYIDDNKSCKLINFYDWELNTFFNLQWKVMPEKTMTRAEAEKQLGVKIVD